MQRAIEPVQQEFRPELIVGLMRLAVEADSVPEAVTPMLTAFVNQTAAVGSAYFQVNGESYQARAASGLMPSGPIMDGILLHGLPEETPLMVALRQSTAPLFFADTSRSPETAGFPELGVPSMAAAPVRDRGGELLGAFLMHTFQPHEWSADEAALFTAVAGAMAALTVRLVAEEQAVSARENALRALGLALEARDGETKGHTDRVCDLAQRVGQAMLLDQASLASLRWGSYLHDVGKIGIPDAILRKPAKLDEAEWEQIRTHPDLGYRFAGQLGFLSEAVTDVVRHHHERWDGAGYPEGLAGVEIALAARIFAVCDVYDALISDRPYKAAWTHEAAMAEIVSQRGKHFDPAVVDAFVMVVE